MTASALIPAAMPNPGSAPNRSGASALGLSLAIGLPLVAAAALGWQAWRLGRGVQRGRALAAATQPFGTRPRVVKARVLLLGDSTGVGVGALRPEATLAGLLAEDFPQLEVVNRCRNGARLTDAAAQCQGLLAHDESLTHPCEAHRSDDAVRAIPKPFDLVLLFVGGNDVIRFAAPARLVGDARPLLANVARLTRHAVWMGSANIGGSPLLLPPLSWWMGRRTARAMQALGREAKAHGVEFIDFVRHGRDDLFARHSDVYFAKDGLHPSAASYRHCYDVLKARIDLGHLLGSQGPHAPLPTRPPSTGLQAWAMRRLLSLRHQP